MNTVLAFVWPFSENVVERLGWTLVHSLWQFALVALVSGVVVRAMHRTSSTLRYGVLVTAMVASVAAPMATWWLMPRDVPTTLASSGAVAPEQHLGDPSDPRTGELRPASDGSLASDEKRQSPAPDTVASETQSEVLPQSAADLEPESSWSERTKTAVRPWLVWIVAGWSLGVVVCSVRPLLGWHTLRRLKRVGVSRVSDDVLAALRRVSERLGLRRGAVQLLQSTLTHVPIVVGYFRPVILLPVSLATSIPAAQLEAILAHELAHVQRHDFVVNLLQTLVETLFFYHPAVWWLSRQIRIEREHCCDDLVVNLLENRVEYGRALVAIEQQRGKHSVLALGAADGSLLSRVRRIVGSNSERTSTSQVERWPAAILGIVLLCISIVLTMTWNLAAKDEPKVELTTSATNLPNGVTVESSSIQTGGIRTGEWPMWGGSSHRNHVASGQIPTEWDLKTGRNVQWTAKLGTSTYASPVVSGGKVFLGTNNAAGLDPRQPKEKDLSCLLSVDQATGKLLWQYASEKLPQGRAHDWPGIGLCSTACVEGDRLWVVTNRCEVVCLDMNGFRDSENDGDFTAETGRTEMDADVVWKFDMFKTLNVRPLHQAVSSIAVVDGVVLLNTSNGPDESRRNVPAPKAPHFLALDARTGRVVWQDNSAGESIIVGGSSCGCSGTSPAVATIGGVTQAIFAGREGWLYGFDFADLKQGKTTRLWQFDCNPKTSKYNRGSQSARNTLVGSPVVVGDRVFIATGRNPEEGEGPGDLWCIDAQKRGDISSELVFNNSHRDGQEPIPHKPFAACDPKQGDFTRPNPNSGAIWHYVGTDRNHDGKLGFDEAFHRSISNPTIHDDLLFIPDFSGLLHCVDASTGEGLWTHDLLAAVWSSCVIVDGHVLIGDEDGDLAIFNAARTYQPVHDEPANLGTPIYSTPVVVNRTLFIAGKDKLVAIGGEQPKAPRPQAVPAVPANENPAEKTENKHGTLSGRFVYDGEPPARKDWYSSFAEIDISQPQQPGPGGRFSGVEAVYRDFLKHKIRPNTEDASLLVGSDGGIANVVVWVVSRDIPSGPQGELAPAVIQLKDGNFSPRFAAVTVGQPLLIENKDPVPLNIAAEFSRALNPSFNVILPTGTTAHRMTFGASEPYPATYQSNLAPWANGRVFVHGNPFVAVSQPDGSFTLPNLPTGDWEFQVWHEQGGFVQHWPNGRFKQSIEPGDNKLGTIKLKPEHLGQKPAQAIATTPPAKNREQIGEVLGKPVYRDEVTDDTLRDLFLNPVLAKYQDAHRAAITPTEDEIKFAAEFFDNEHRKRLDAEGGEAKLREQMKSLEERLAGTDLPFDEQQKLELAHLVLRHKLKPPGRLFAEFMLNSWKFQKHLYEEFGGGRVLWQQAGQEAFDATRICLESLEKKGEFKITDTTLRAKLFDYWTRSHGSFLTDDQERIRKQFLEPEWIAPGAAKVP